MNVFVLDKDPVIAAIQQCDKHIVKMIVESAQMLSTTHRMLDGVRVRKPSKSGKTTVNHYILPEHPHENILHKAVHFNHPCTVWTRESLENYEWHYRHFVALCDEYRYRYGKIHLSDTLLRDVLKTPPKNIPQKGLTQFPLAMKSNPECMFPDNPVKSYQLFYQTKQKRFSMVWTKRKIPKWFKKLTK